MEVDGWMRGGGGRRKKKQAQQRRTKSREARSEKAEKVGTRQKHKTHMPCTEKHILLQSAEGLE